MIISDSGDDTGVLVAFGGGGRGYSVTTTDAAVTFITEPFF